MRQMDDAFEIELSIGLQRLAGAGPAGLEPLVLMRALRRRRIIRITTASGGTMAAAIVGVMVWIGWPVAPRPPMAKDAERPRVEGPVCSVLPQLPTLKFEAPAEFTVVTPIGRTPSMSIPSGVSSGLPASAFRMNAPTMSFGR